MDYEEIKVLKQDILSSLHCALPGIVVSFDAESQTAVIQPAVSRVIPTEVEGSPSEQVKPRNRSESPLP